MVEQLFAIIRNTFFESIRQPIVLVLLVVATLLIIFSNATSAFTMEDDQKMLVDIGLATIFIFGALLASFIASNVLTREIENRTVLTVISKPVGRPLFVIGKFLGVAGAILLSTIYMAFVFLLVENHGVMETVRHPYHLPVIIFGLIAAIVSVAVGIWCNYFYGRVFTSTVICTITPLAGLAYFFSMLFDPHFAPRAIGESFEGNIWMAIGALIVAIVVLTAIAIAVSTRLNQLMTIIVTIAIFVFGMLSDALFGQPMHGYEQAWMQVAKQQGEVETVEMPDRIVYTTGEVYETTKQVEVPTEPLTSYATGSQLWAYAGLKVAYSVVPNFQVLWLSDAVTQRHVIPLSYLIKVTLYGLCFVVGSLAIATILFQTREVG